MFKVLHIKNWRALNLTILAEMLHFQIWWISNN